MRLRDFVSLFKDNSLIRFTNKENNIFDTIGSDLLSIHVKSYKHGLYAFNPDRFAYVEFKSVNAKYELLSFDFASESSSKIKIIVKSTGNIISEFTYNEGEGIVNESANVEGVIELKIEVDKIIVL